MGNILNVPHEIMIYCFTNLMDSTIIYKIEGIAAAKKKTPYK